MREALASAGVAGVVAALLAWVGPPGSDLAAHAYQRAVFVEHGFTLWNNFWYAGHYSFVTYSILYYPLAAVVGIHLLAVATVATGALAYAVIVWREWGPAARWSSRTFAVVWAGIILAAAFPFALGATLALFALWALQAKAPWGFAVLALLTLAASPLAFALLALSAVAVGLAKRIEWRRLVVPVVALGAIGGVGLLLWRLFPDGGRYPFSIADLAAVCVFSGLGAALIWRVERARLLRMILLVYGTACIAVYFVPSAVGSNIIRLQFLAVPITVLIASLRSWRPLPICLVALALALSWNVKPLVRSFVQDAENPAASEAYWQPAIRFLRVHLRPSYRVEAVDTVGHWPALYLPAAGIPLARGWFRQDDFPENSVLYRPLTPTGYAAWLRRLGVRYVVLTHAEPDYSSQGEARLLESGRSGLGIALRTRDVTIFAVPAPVGILTGSRGARVIRFSQTRLVLKVDRRGRYRLAVRYSPYWRVSSGCLAARGDGMTEIFAPRPETILVSFHLNGERALATLAGQTTQTCAGGTRPSTTTP
jgi:hypothetical protein